jgi:hypothetical protein
MSEPTEAVKPAALGDLERIPFPSLLYTLYKKRFTGHVEIREGGKATTVYFREGTPVAALLPTQTEHLGRILLETGVIDQPTWEESLRVLTETGRRQGDILKEMGKLTDEQLTAGLKLQLRRKLTGVFGIAKASFEVYAVDHQFGREAELSQMRVHPRRIIYGGIRSRYDDARLDREARSLEGFAARITAEAAGSLDKYAIDPVDRPVVEALRQGYHTLDQLCAETGCERTVARMILYALWVTEALEFADPATLVAGSPAERTAPAVPAAPPSAAPLTTPRPTSRSALVAPVTSSTLPVLRPRLRPPMAPVPTPPPMAARRLTTPLPAPAAVAAPRDPTPPGGTAAVGDGPGAKVPTPAAARRGADDRPVMSAKSSEGGGIATLVGQKLRSEVEARFNQIEKHNLWQVLGVEEGASKDQVRAAYLELAKVFHPDRVPAAGTGDLRPKMERVFARISEAHATLCDDQARRKYEQTARDSAQGNSSRAQRILEGEIAFQKGMVLLRRKDWLPALAELRRAVSLNADEAEHHALLAWAIYQAASDKVKAGAEVKPMLLKALGLQPRCHHAHFYLGEILMAEGTLPQALSSYQRVLAHDPDNVDAQRAVRLINLRLEKDSKKGGGLFDRFRKK